MSKKISVLLFLCAVTTILDAQILQFEMQCRFDISRIMEVDGYTCTISDLVYDFSSPFYFIRIVGEHMDELTNADVRNVRITNSRINRIPSNIFNVFPNAEALELIACYDFSFQNRDFFFADKLVDIRVVESLIPTIGDSPFFGASGMEVLNLDNNRIEELQDSSFMGLSTLRHLSLANNNIKVITRKMLAPLIRLGLLWVFPYLLFWWFYFLFSLQLFIAPDNDLQQLDGRLFIHNPLLITVNVEGNQIDNIGSSFLSVNQNIQFLFMSRNVCVNSNFINTNLEAIREALAECFENSPLGTQITLNVAGSLTIFDENDEVLIRVEWILHKFQ